MARVDALCLRTHDYGDSSQIVVLLARGRGKLRCIARGAKNSVKRFAGAIEPLTLLDVDLGRRSKGEGLVTMKEADVLDGFFYLRRRLPSLAAGCYVLDFLAELLPDEQACDPLFELGLTTLARLIPTRADLEEEVLVFELRALQELGIFPNLETCVACAAPVDTQRDATFDTLSGGVVCPRCRIAGRPVAVCAGTRATVRALLGTEGPITERQETLRLTARARGELRRVLDAQVEDFLDRDLRVRKHWGMFAKR